MKKGLSRRIVGTLFIIIQLISLAGNAKAGVGFQLSFDSMPLFLYDIMFLVGNYFVGILGAIFLISGIIAKRKSEEV